MRFVFLLIALLFSWATCSAQAQSVHTEDHNDRYLLYYELDEIDIQPDYLDNEYQMARIRQILSRATRIDSIVVYAYASPEGPLWRNIWLAERRAETARNYILANIRSDSILDPKDILLRPMGENWEGLRNELEENYHRQNRDVVMRIMRSNLPTETKKQRLKALDKGYTLHLIIKDHMPKLRYATWICVYAAYPEYSIVEPIRIRLESKAPSTPNLTELAHQLDDYKTVLALKTNLLYDAATLLNYSVEVPFSEKFSALIYHQFPWWTWGEANNEYCIRFLSVGAEARWWFKPKPRPQLGDRKKRDRLMGSFIGLYGESGKWDFQWGRDVICYQGEHWSCGLTYGYAMPVGKRLNFEFSLSAGYASIAHRKFFPSEDYEILWEEPSLHGRWHYFGPTKAQISLVIPITAKINKKGGNK